MAFDPKPSTWLGAGYTVASHVAGFNTQTASANKTLPQLTDTQADPTTGDIRDVAFAICESLYQAWLTQGSAAQPTRMTIARSAATGSTTTGTIKYTYFLTFQLTPTPTGTVVVAE
jgi:hypothetical protein